MKPDTIEWFRAAQRSLAALRRAQPFSRELERDLEEKEQILAELIIDPLPRARP
jgi:hypothetical protein